MIGLKGSIYQMVDESGENCIACLTWVLLSRNTAFQPELDTTSAESVYGTNPIVPGYIVGDPGPPLSKAQLNTLQEALRAHDAKPSIPTSGHRTPPKHTPPDLDKVTHVRIKRHKTMPLQHTYLK